MSSGLGPISAQMTFQNFSLPHLWNISLIYCASGIDAYMWVQRDLNKRDVLINKRAAKVVYIFETYQDVITVCILKFCTALHTVYFHLL